ncbi:UNVERIFIED_CONTAM: B3 domain-containing transcription factor ABI3 [Sesamum angustifolium]|uniref:B3 domain-containing transcription factor ABI3 n=1 Tax=Sesamum angustifolium TaxID=2727405 RepID=A0AAW2IQX7_9LAMI
MEHAQSWVISPFPMQQPHQFSHFPDNGNMITHQQALYGHPYHIFDPNGERLMRLGSSATKEARKKRMARQRRLYSHHHRHSSNSNQHQNQMNDGNVVGEAGEDGDQAGSPGNWVYWSPSGAGSSPTPGTGPPTDASQPHSGDRPPVQQQNYQRQSSSDRRQQQGWKTEKNLKFLLQKVLKQSDVGNLGRIVLPKKEAESHLPELESRDGISIAMEDIGTSRVWNMRYRFWPNNKSRMYLLENTGDFVRVNGLQEGDFIVIYSDTKCGKYMIRGVKVRQPAENWRGRSRQGETCATYPLVVIALHLHLSNKLCRGGQQCLSKIWATRVWMALSVGAEVGQQCRLRKSEATKGAYFVGIGPPPLYCVCAGTYCPVSVFVFVSRTLIFCYER